jgi:hypothetical protein
MLCITLLSLFVLPIVVVQAVRQYTIENKCPSPITLYINGTSQGTVAANGGIIQKNFDNNFEGFIYTDANGGNKDGSGTTRAGFYGVVSISISIVLEGMFS